jgi:virulence factor Mce-like protein
MKAKNGSNYIIASVVVLCSLLLLATLTVALRGIQWKKGGRTLYVDLQTAIGIKLHSGVRYAGAPAGTVTEIRYLKPEERRGSSDPRNVVRITIRLDENVPPIPSDVRAGLAAETILGEKFIALTPGSPSAPPLADGAVIQGQEVIAFDALARTAQAALINVNEILTRLNADYPSLVPRLAQVLESANSLLVQGSNLVQNVDGTVTNANGVVTTFRGDYTELVSKLNAILGRAQVVVTNTDEAIQRVSGLVGRADLLVQNNEQDLHKILEEMRVVSQNLKVISTYTKSLTGTLAERPSRLIWSRGKTPLPSEQQILDSPQPVPVQLPQK